MYRQLRHVDRGMCSMRGESGRYLEGDDWVRRHFSVIVVRNIVETLAAIY